MIKKNNIFNLMFVIMVLIVPSAMAYNEFPDLVSNWDLDDANQDGLVNETSGIVDGNLLNDGVLYGKTFNHGTNNGATLNNNLTGTIIGATWNGNELEFDGNGDYVEVGDISFGGNKEILLYTEFTPTIFTQAGLIGQSTEILLRIKIDGSVEMLLNSFSTNDRISSSNKYVLNEENYVAGYYDGTNLCVNLNNVITCITPTGSYGDSSSYFNIGKAGSLGEYFNGTISDVIILDKALSETEVLNLYNTGTINTTGYYHEINFPLDEGTGTEVYTDEGKFGGYYEFDGINDQIEINPSIFNSDVETWCVEFNINDFTGSNSRVLGFTGGRGNIVVRTDLKLGAEMTDATRGLRFIGTTILEPNTPYFACVDYDNEVLYLNGEIDDAVAQTIGTSATEDTLYIGSRGGSNYFNGTIDEVKIWNRALTQTEIQEEMSANAVANPEGIVAYYDFNEEEGTTVYDNNHLTTGNGQTDDINDAIFKWDKAMSFDGVDDYVEINNADSFNESGTMSLWHNANSFSNARVMISNNDFSPSLQLRLNGNKYVVYANNSITSDSYTYSSNNLNEYYLTTISYNSTNVLIYVNGILKDTFNFGGDFSDTNDLYLGSYGGASDYFDGSIADVRIYDRALSEAEITTLYEGSLLVENGATVTPTNQSFNTDEGTTVTFEVETSWSNTVKWYLDGIFQTIGDSWTWFVGVQDADIDPEKQVIALAENDTDSDTYVWDVTVDQAFPLEIDSISPNQGVFDSNIPINCYVDDSKYWFKDSLFDYQLYYDSEWHNSTINSSSMYHQAYTLHVAEQSDVQVRCRSFDGVYYSNWSETSGMNLTISHKKNKLELFDLSGVRRKTVYTQSAYNSHCKIDSDINNEYISNIYIDCENDGLWDGMLKHNSSEQVKEDSLFSVCTFPEVGSYKVSTGCIIEKTNQSEKWKTQFCVGLADTDDYCNYNKDYLVTVVGTNQ